MSRVYMQINISIKIGLKWVKFGGRNKSAWPTRSYVTEC